jgi:hypothetical protein
MGTFEHPILEDIILEQWFPRKKKMDGIVYSVSFNPIPEATIALVSTAVYSCKELCSAGNDCVFR